MDSEIIEADFQQYYHLALRPLLRQDFPRFCRLLLNLPFESRFVQKYAPSKDWNWDKEVQSRILHTLDIIKCQIANMAKKSGQSSAKPQPQFQPDYVEKAKAEAAKAQQGIALSADDLNDIKDFWAEYNRNVGSKNGN